MTDLFTPDTRRTTLVALLDKILADPDWADSAVSQIAAEMCRASVGIGKHALVVPKRGLR